jgi:hypothetical protein
MASRWGGGTVTRFIRSLRTERAAAVTAIGLVIALVGAAAMLSGAAHRVSSALSGVGAWLTNDTDGSVSHANGLSGKVDAQVPLTNAKGHPLKITQDGDVVIVVDTVTGQVTRIDPGQLTVTQSVDFGSSTIQVVAGGGLAYLVDAVRGLTQQIDPVQLTPIGLPVQFPPPLAPTVVDPHGTLWVPVPAAGAVVPVNGDTPGDSIHIGASGARLSVTLAGDAPVVTDASDGTMTVLTGGRRTFTLPLAGSGPVLTPSATDGPVVPLLSPGSRQLLIVDTAAGRPMSVHLDGYDGHDLGTPQTLSGRVYIPDNSTGRLIVYDSSTGRLLNEITVSPGPSRIELFVHEGLLWANDAGGANAVCVDKTGTAHEIDKYKSDVPGGDEPSPSPTPSATSADTGGSGGGSGEGSGGGGGGGGNGGGPTQTTPPPTTQPPAPTQPPTGVGEKSGANTIEVTFSPAAGATPTRYTLSGAPSGATVKPGSVGPGGPYTFTVSGLACQQYTFTVVAEYPNETKSASGTPAFACLAPSQPQSLGLDTGTQHQITAHWSAPADNGGGAVSYTAAVKGGASVDVGTATAATLTGLTNFGTYQIFVTARNAAGSSNPAASASAALNPPRKNGNIYNNCCYYVNERSGPHLSSGIVRMFAPNSGAPVTVDCIQGGDAWRDPSGNPNGNTWFHLTAPQQGWVATGYVTVPNDQVWACDNHYGT